MKLSIFIFLWALSSAPAAGAETPAKSVTFLLPGNSFSLKTQKEIAGIVTQYNQRIAKDNPAARVKILHRGEDFSSLRDLIAMHLAGILPDLAVIEIDEFPAVAPLNIAVPIHLAKLPDSRWFPEACLNKGNPKTPWCIPFERTAPLLLINRDKLPSSDKLPTTWPELEAMTRAAKSTLALPLQGGRGLWIFEALAGEPLWHREAAGLKANRNLLPVIRKLQAVYPLLFPDGSWEQSVQAFLDRKTPFLIASTDALPSIRAQATFSWEAKPIPPFFGANNPSLLQGGSSLLATRDAPEVWNFLEFFYSPEISAQWLKTGGLLPLWHPPGKVPAYRHRTTDANVVRARAAWIQSLPLLFGSTQQRQPVEDVFIQIDHRLTSEGP